MNIGRYIFSQVVDYIPRYQFDKAVAKYHGDWHTKELSCYNPIGKQSEEEVRVAAPVLLVVYRPEVEVCLYPAVGRLYLYLDCLNYSY